MLRWNDAAPYAAVSLSVVFWGLSFVATKIALESVTLFTLLSLRFMVAAAVFLLLMAWRGFPRFSRKEHLQLFLAALFQPGMYFFCETTGLQYTSASKASLIIATIPVLVLALSVIFLNERLRFRVVTGLALSVLGVALLIVGDPQFQRTLAGSMIGDLLILGAVLAMAIYTVTMKDLASRQSPIDITGLLMCYGALFFTPPFLRELPQVAWGAVQPESWIALAGLALFATIGAFLSFNYALSKLPASRASIFLNCVPVVTTFGAWLILDERLSLLQGAGGALVLVAVYLTNFTGRREPEPALQPSSLAESKIS